MHCASNDCQVKMYHKLNDSSILESPFVWFLSPSLMHWAHFSDHGKYRARVSPFRPERLGQTLSKYVNLHSSASGTVTPLSQLLWFSSLVVSSSLSPWPRPDTGRRYDPRPGTGYLAQLTPGTGDWCRTKPGPESGALRQSAFCQLSFQLESFTQVFRK